MRETNVQLMAYESTSGTVSLDGQRATVVLDAAIHSDEGGDAQIVRESVPADSAERQLVRRAGDTGIADDSRLTKEIPWNTKNAALRCCLR